MYVVVPLEDRAQLLCQVFPRECTETFQEGHSPGLRLFRGRISYDNSRIAVSRIVGRRGETPTRQFLRLTSHFLFAPHFCRVPSRALFRAEPSC